MSDDDEPMTYAMLLAAFQGCIAEWREARGLLVELLDWHRATGLHPEGCWQRAKAFIEKTREGHDA